MLEIQQVILKKGSNIIFIIFSSNTRIREQSEFGGFEKLLKFDRDPDCFFKANK